MVVALQLEKELRQPGVRDSGRIFLPQAAEAGLDLIEEARRLPGGPEMPQDQARDADGMAEEDPARAVRRLGKARNVLSVADGPGEPSQGETEHLQHARR